MEPIWFEAEHIIRMNEKIVAARGESHLVLNHGMIESAIIRPVNLFHYEGVTDLFVLALRLLEAIGKNHCFEQGNKRTAHMAGFLFLKVNDAPFEQMDDVAHAKLLSRLITGKVSFEEVVSWCRPTVE